ncbi:serine/threonine receptor-like kinase NFP [Neltuma alba]|uniref:serine/threonine receptor-like kinase NFP n=1 Tax=Neltuma alba TaxID=207710 RepID=UPI0010A30DB8|nr:serine/threonine receptor-like kinase NFP [Prosopis alba]
MIVGPSNISSPTSTLAPNEPLFVHLSCSCNFINSTFSAIKKGDMFCQVSMFSYRNLTTYQFVEVVNPILIPTNLMIGVSAVFHVFYKCPNTTQLRKCRDCQCRRSFRLILWRPQLHPLPYHL